MAWRFLARLPQSRIGSGSVRRGFTTAASVTVATSKITVSGEPWSPPTSAFTGVFHPTASSALLAPSSWEAPAEAAPAWAESSLIALQSPLAWDASVCGLGRSAVEELEMLSTRRKKKLKMNRHKAKKRRKLNRMKHKK
eukprot:CAMPEP_0205829292 /NCGR_PEP_ID=MMETSP0206-20130828/37716_1 /ASSEMBLY_ACC=CAM_ASM_000279 /TAXON_ID=36767 /ORGANISM="Euplotes focardii, Strain TN1" /LENGTH=138 /DNA_ID=CAMNT_0053131899 /DNA_START=21 /DNA_END=434 /DNA_ORIENTATION=+